MQTPTALTDRPTASWWQRRQAKLAPLLFVAPAFLAFALFVLAPIVQSVWISLHEWDGMGPMTFVGLDNYRELADDRAFRIALGNNTRWLLLFLLAPVAGLALALLLNQRMRGMRLVKALFFFPFVLSQVVVGLVFSWFYDPNFGLLNQLLGAVGAAPLSPLGDERLVTYFIILAGLWPQVAYCMILYLAGLSNVSSDVIEAARLDGAQGPRMLWSIILPQLRPASFMAVVVTIIGALRSFDLVSIMTQGGPYDSSTVLAYLMYEQSIFSYRMGYGAAVATVLFVIMDVFIAFFLYSLLRKERD
ncbi:MAG TPA: sugar ABC transporter permease [Myxococcaceae bacterium]|nr:sugar ABC transporter permease [Myxococcaceae bacterium]